MRHPTRSSITKASWKDPVIRAKHLRGIRKKICRQKLSLAVKKVWEDPVAKRERSLAIKHGQSGKQYRKRRSEITSGLWNNKDFRSANEDHGMLSLSHAEKRKRFSKKICRYCGSSFIPGSGRAKTCRKCLRARPLCACGCGEKVTPIGRTGGPQKVYVGGHQPRNGEKISKTLLKQYACGKLPARFGAHMFKRGYSNTIKAGKVWYRSSYERDSMVVLDASPEVASFVSQPFRIPYRYCDCVHTYFPDFLVVFTNGRKVLLETKGPVKDPRKEKAKIAAARVFCAKQAIPFVYCFKAIESVEDLK